MSQTNNNQESAQSPNSDIGIVNIFQRQSNNQPQNTLVEDIRIEIHSVPTTSSDINMSNNNLTPTIPNNLRALLGRQADRRWEVNLRNVFQGVRPFVQRAQTMNGFRNFMPNNSTFYVPLRNNTEQDDSTNLRDGLINGNPGNSSSSQTLNIGEVFSSNESNNNNHPSTSEGTTSPARPILDRVAALTRDDPPDLIDGPASSRHNRRQGDDDGGEEDNAVAEVFAQVPEARQAFNVLARYIPFICILLAKSAYDHLHGILDLTALGAIFIHANSTVRNQAMKQIQRQVSVLARELLYIAVIVFLRFFYSDGDSFLGLLLVASLPSTLTLGQLLFAVAVTDLLLKLITITIKIFVIMLPPSVIRYKGRGRIFVLIESLSQLYRTLAPIQPWMVFLLDSYSGLEKILGVIFSAAYMVSKAFDLVAREKLCRRAFLGLLKKVNYGTVPTNEDIQIAGGQCPICHDNFDTPVMLECKHIFCELCVGTWFSKQQTCPLCRSKVAEDPSWQDGATSFFLQLY